MPIVTGNLAFYRLYTIDTIVAGDFGGTHPNNTLDLTGISQVHGSATDPNTKINDVNGNGVLNGADVVTTTFPGAGSTTDLARVNLFAQFGSIADSFGSGIDYAIFEDPSGQQYILFSENFDITRISGGSITLTEQGDAPGNMDNDEIICFAAGSMIATPTGEVRVEDIKVGDVLSTYDHGTTTVHWVSQSRCSAAQLRASPKLRPVRIAAQTFGPNMQTGTSTCPGNTGSCFVHASLSASAEIVKHLLLAIH